jgi:hypothetical protein
MQLCSTHDSVHTKDITITVKKGEGTDECGPSTEFLTFLKGKTHTLIGRT